MAENGIKPEEKRQVLTYLLFFWASGLLLSCSSMDIKRDEVTIPQQVYEVRKEEPVVKEPAMPDFVPATEDMSPLKTRIVDIVARHTALRDALYVIAEATGLNLVIEKGVASETPVTMTLRHVTAEDALQAVLSSADYFYAINNNMLVVKAVDTKIYELGRPSVIQSYNVDLGGDIFGSALAAGATGSGAGQQQSQQSGTTNIKGNITQSAKNDPAAFGFWDAIEKSIANILGIQAGPLAASAAPPGQGQIYAAEISASRQSFTVNRLAGTIIVTASKRNLERIDQYLGAVKKVINRQVLIEAKIIEVQLSNGLQYGIDWTQALSKWSGIYNSASFGTKNFASVVSTGSAAFNVALAGNLTLLLNALQQQGEVRTLSNPRVNIMNGQTSLLTVGRSNTFISNVNTSTTAVAGASPITTFTIGTSTVLSGIMIGIVPFISEDGEISLTITPIVSNLVQLQNTSVGQSGNQTQISLPTIDLRELSTTVKVRDGQMVIIGGLISQTESLQDNKVPGIGAVPGVGQLFTSRNKSENRSELVVVLQPAIISK